MRGWLELTSELSEYHHAPTVCRHEDRSVSFSLPGYTAPHGMGFCIRFFPNPALIKSVRDLLTELEDLQRKAVGKAAEKIIQEAFNVPD